MRPNELRAIIKAHKRLIKTMEKMLEAAPPKPVGKLFPSDKIIEEVNKEFNCELATPTKIKKIVFARHAGVYFLRNHTKMTWREISYATGNTDHSTSIHSYTTCENLIETDEDYSIKINNIKERLLSLGNFYYN